MDSRLSKEGLCNEKVIALWAPNRQTKMVVNLDPVGIAATWYQQDTEKGINYTINYSSRAVT